MNPRPSDYKSDALPTELRQLAWCVERETGIEPATNSLEGCDSTIELLPPALREPHYPAAGPFQLYGTGQARVNARNVDLGPGGPKIPG